MQRIRCVVRSEFKCCNTVAFVIVDFALTKAAFASGDKVRGSSLSTSFLFYPASENLLEVVVLLHNRIRSDYRNCEGQKIDADILMNLVLDDY